MDEIESELLRFEAGFLLTNGDVLGGKGAR